MPTSRAQDHMEQVLQAMTALLISVDLQQRITHWNGVATELFGLPEGAVFLRPLAECAIPWEPAPVQAGVEACRREGRPVRVDDVRFTYPDGAEGWLGFTLTPLRDPGGAVTGCLLLGADITQRKQAERERHEQAAILQAANVKLKELAAVKDEFVAKASHELRTPLTAIKEGISLMLDAALGPINDEQLDFMKTVDENIDRLTELISNMLDISKIEAGRMRLQRRRVDLRQLLETTLSGYRAFAGKRTLTTEPGEVPHVFADSNRIIQVLGNFISNAVKFSPANGAITFSLALRNGSVAVSVKDNGMGITQDDVPKLFKKFSQVGEGQNKPRGTGLGLALCKELVEMHRGAIAVDSVLGAGTTFTFTLPVYTSSFVLEESFAELVEAATANQQEAVTLVAIDNEPLLGRWPQAQADQRVWHLEQVVEGVRKHLHRGDMVLAIEPHWVVVLAIADAEGAQAMMSRLRPALREWSDALVGTSEGAPVNFGAAVYPLDGASVHDLFAKATSQLNQGLAAVRG